MVMTLNGAASSRRGPDLKCDRRNIRGRSHISHHGSSELEYVPIVTLLVSTTILGIWIIVATSSWLKLWLPVYCLLVEWSWGVLNWSPYFKVPLLMWSLAQWSSLSHAVHFVLILYGIKSSGDILELASWLGPQLVFEFWRPLLP